MSGESASISLDELKDWVIEYIIGAAKYAEERERLMRNALLGIRQIGEVLQKLERFLELEQIDPNEISSDVIDHFLQSDGSVYKYGKEYTDAFKRAVEEIFASNSETIELGGANLV